MTAPFYDPLHGLENQPTETQVVMLGNEVRAQRVALGKLEQAVEALDRKIDDKLGSIQVAMWSVAGGLLAISGAIVVAAVS